MTLFPTVNSVMHPPPFPVKMKGFDFKRDQVALMVSHTQNDEVVHTTFRHLSCFLQAGDVLVINTSGTLNAALPVVRSDGSQLELHLSTRLPADLWSVELRLPEGHSTVPFYKGVSGEQLALPDGGKVTLHTPHHAGQRFGENGHIRLWLASLQLPLPLGDYLALHGFPIRYSYVREAWPISYYQTVFANEVGSAEMPSAGRAFTHEMITELVAKGVQIAPLILHTGVASLEDHEPPYEEFYKVSLQTAVIINNARKAGNRIIAVGTTVVRTLETVTDVHGITHPGEGWTNLVITPHRKLRSVDGLITGMHEPKATHLAMLAAFAGYPHLRVSYEQALQRGYLWHEFGDMHLIVR